MTQHEYTTKSLFDIEYIAYNWVKLERRELMMIIWINIELCTDHNNLDKYGWYINIYYRGKYIYGYITQSWVI